jgi:hypothetical protein
MIILDPPLPSRGDALVVPMPDELQMWPTVYPPIEVTWNAEQSQLVLVGTVGVEVDQRIRFGLEMTPAASRQLLLCIARLLEHVDADAIDTRPRDLQ